MKLAPMKRFHWAVKRRSTKRGAIGTYAMDRTPKGYVVPTFWNRAEARAYARRVRIPGFTATPIRIRSTIEEV